MVDFQWSKDLQVTWNTVRNATLPYNISGVTLADTVDVRPIGADVISAGIPTLANLRADGWSADYASTPPTFDPVGAPVTVSVSRQGFTTAGATTTITDLLTVTQRVRQAFPNQATLDPTRVALSDYVYSTDTIAGVTNNSALTSPKPIARYALSDRRVVGNTLHLEVVAAHLNARSGEEIAAVKHVVTDGTTTVTSIVSASSILGHAGDKNPVVGYAADIDVTTLATGAITVTTSIYPWVGGAAAVQTLTSTYLKNVALLVSPPIAVIDPAAGVDASGVVSKTQATADASPFLTLQGALAGIKAQTGVTGGFADGCIIQIKAGGAALTASAAVVTYNNVGETVITRHASATRAQAVFNFGTGNFKNNMQYLRFTDVSIVRGGAFYIGSALQTAVELCNWDNGGNTANNSPWASTAVLGFMMGVTITNNTAANFLAVATAENRLIRGVDMRAAGASALNVEHGCVIGCYFENCATNYASGTRQITNVFEGFNKWMKMQTTQLNVGNVSTDVVTGFASIQNVVEYIAAVNNPGFRVSSDNGFANTTHVVLHHNTMTGNGDLGRDNLAYDENTTDATRRTHTLWSVVGEAISQLNTKSDLFVGINQARTAEAPNRIGNWPIMYGVGFRGLITQYPSADTFQNGTGTNFTQAYSGLDALNAPADGSINMLFVNPQQTTAGPTAGAGGGNYAIQAGSPAIGKVKSRVLKFDLAGLARGLTTATGAYVATAGN